MWKVIHQWKKKKQSHWRHQQSQHRVLLLEWVWIFWITEGDCLKKTFQSRYCYPIRVHAVLIISANVFICPSCPAAPAKIGLEIQRLPHFHSFKILPHFTLFYFWLTEAILQITETVTQLKLQLCQKWGLLVLKNSLLLKEDRYCWHVSIMLCH